jgi:hypothetical protein
VLCFWSSEKLLHDPYDGEETRQSGPARDRDSSLTTAKKKVHNFQEGYLTARGLGKAYFAAEWTRFYFVFEGDEFFYYKSKEAFKLDPKKSVKNRPISLAGYVICTMKDDKTGALQIILEPLNEEDNRRKWEFRLVIVIWFSTFLCIRAVSCNVFSFVLWLMKVWHHGRAEAVGGSFPQRWSADVRRLRGTVPTSEWGEIE